MNTINKLTKQNYPEFSKKAYKMAFLQLFNTTDNEDNDPINTKIWGILSKEQKNNISESFEEKIKHTSSETKKDILTILKLRDSLNGKRKLYETSIEKLIKNQSENIGIGLEFFLWDALERNNPNEEISFEKPGYHLDQKYCSDLIVTYKDIKGIKKNIGIDFSLASDRKIKSKKKDKGKRINKKLKNGLTDYSKKRSPINIGILFLNKEILGIENNNFSKALRKFYNNTKQYKGGPSKYLNNNTNKQVDNLSQILLSIFEKLKNNVLSNYSHLEYDISIKEKGNEIIVKAKKKREILFEFILNK